MTKEYYTGIRERIAQAREEDFGQGSPNFEAKGRPFGLDQEMEIGDWSRGWTEILNNGDGTMQIYDKVKGIKSYPFTLNFKVTDWEFLKYLFKVEHKGESGGVHTYELTIDPTVSPFELEWLRRHTSNPLILQLIGAFAKSFSITYSAGGMDEGGFINASLTCNAKRHDLKESEASLSSFTKSPFRFFESRLILAGETITEVNEGEINGDRNINEEDSRYASKEAGREIHDPIPKIHRFNNRHNITIKNTDWLERWATDEPLEGENSIEFIKTPNEEQVKFIYGTIWLESPSIGNTQREDRTTADLITTGIIEKIEVKTKEEWDI